MSLTFKDHKNREWNCAITVGAVKRIRDATKINLCDAIDGKLLIELGNDTLKFVEILYHLLKPQAEAAKVDDDELAESLWGDTLNAAYESFVEGLISFFQRPEQREVLGRLMTKTKETQTKAGEAALRLIESDTMSRKIESEFQKAIAAAESILTS